MTFTFDKNNSRLIYTSFRTKNKKKHYFELDVKKYVNRFFLFTLLQNLQFSENVNALEVKFKKSKCIFHKLQTHQAIGRNVDIININVYL